MAAVPGKDSSRSRRRLGRGLDSLLAKPPVAVDIENDADSTTGAARTAAVDRSNVPASEDPPAQSSRRGEPTAIDEGDDDDRLRMIPIDAISPNRHQPRRTFDEDALQSLAMSIRQAGVMQPVVLRPMHDGQYEMVAGERRWRAARTVGIERIPAIVRTIDDQAAAELALVENLQREDLSPIERAEAFQRLANDFNLTHQAIAERVGLKRASVTNHLRLLELDEKTREALEGGRLTLGHARALLAIANESRRQTLARKAIARSWSVRELERRIQREEQGSERRSRQGGDDASALPAHLVDLQTRLGEHLGTKVRIQPGRKKGTGRLLIDFYSFDEFEGLLERMRFPNE